MSPGSTADLRITRVSDRVWVFTRGGETLLESYGANCTAVAGDRAVLLVDPLIAPQEARRIEEAVAARVRAPIGYVVLTHHHTDHALGAGDFLRRGIPVFAHRSCVERMRVEHPALVASRREDPRARKLFIDAEPYLPSCPFEEEARFDLGGLEAVARFCGPGHTPGDSLIHVAAEDLVVTGDLVSRGYHVNYEDARLERLEAGLGWIAALHPKVVIPGHGPVTDSGEIERQKRYHRRFASIVREEVRRPSGNLRAIGRIREEFPGFLLEQVLPAGVRAWSDH